MNFTVTFGDFSRSVVSKSSAPLPRAETSATRSRKSRELTLAGIVEEALGLKPLAQRFDLCRDCADAERSDLDDAKLILAALSQIPIDPVATTATPSRTAGSFFASLE